MIYRYLAYTNDKRFVRGTIESSSTVMAEEVLYKAGFQRIIELQKNDSRIDWKKLLLGTSRVNKQSLLDFTTELGILIESGLAMLAALRQIERQTSDSSLKKILAKIVNDLNAGTPFHKAIAKYPEAFSETYCSVIESNEKSGTLELGLRQIAKELKQQIAIKSQLQHALIQPCIVAVVAIGVVILLTIVVLPPLVDVFRQMGSKLPFMTQMLIGFTDFVNAYKFHIVLVVLLLIVAVTILSRKTVGKQFFDKIILRLPMIGNIVIWNATSRFSRTMANLLKSGILLPDGMGIVLRTIGNTQIREAVAEVKKKLIQGMTFSAGLGGSKFFPTLLQEMVMVGESSGTLESSLDTVADYFEAKVQKRIEKLTTMLEPAMILVMGLGVGFIAVSVISTIYGMVGAMK